MFSADLVNAATALIAAYRAAGQTIVTAESCTGGLLAGLLTEVPGASEVLERGMVTYSNEAKSELLGVDPALILAHGAVSEPVARAMAVGAVQNSHASVSLAITGIAGPGGGTVEKPVGLVYIAWATAEHVDCQRYVFSGDREAVRLAAVQEALQLLLTPLR